MKLVSRLTVTQQFLVQIEASEPFYILFISMIKLKRLIKEGYNSKSWWLDPQGELHPVAYGGGHDGFAKDYLKRVLGIAPQPDVFKQFQDMGWVRVVFYGNEGAYHIDFNAGRGRFVKGIQKDAIINLAQSLNVYEINDNSNGKRFLTNTWE